MSASTYSSSLSDRSLEKLASLGREIKLARRARGWSQEFARTEIGISRRTLGLIEKGAPNVGIGAYLAALEVLELNL